MRSRTLISAVLVTFAACSLSAQEFIDGSAEIEVFPAERINTKHLEFAPNYYGGGIVFVHARDQDQYIDRKIGVPYFELMYAELGPDGMPGRKVSFSPNIRTRFHEGPAAFSPDEMRVYFTRSNYSRGKEVKGSDGKAHMKIYSAVKGLEDWEEITELPFCNDDFDTWAPTVSADGRTLIFVSNRPGGRGGMDLYRSVRTGGVWSEPVNLGSAINTPDNEAFPFLHRSGVLFFSRDSKEGYGKFDLYAADLDAEEPVPVNLGEAFNSRWDDLSITVSPDGTSGFFASSRKGGLGKDDIYAFTVEPGLIPEQRLMRTKPLSTKLVVTNADNGLPQPDVQAWIFPMGDDGPEGADDLFETEVLNEQGEGRSYVIRLRQKQIDSSIVAPYRSERDGRIDIESKSGNDVLVVLRSEGFEPFQKVLGADLLGAEEVYELRIRPVMERPVADGEPGTVRCTQLAIQVLDRANDQALGNVTASFQNLCDNAVKVHQSDFDGLIETCLIPACDYELILEKDGYALNTSTVEPSTGGAYTYYMEALTLEDRLDELVEGDIVVMSNIYYDFNKSAIRSGDAPELESLARVMNTYKSMEIELRSHTDSRGEDAYNLELAEMRAFAALEFLVARGVSADRIKLNPMGERALVNACADGVRCSEEQHAQNRRTEIVILKMPEAARDELRQR